MKTQALKNISLYFSSLFLFILHIPFVFAKNKPFDEIKPVSLKIETTTAFDSSKTAENMETHNTAFLLYDSMHLNRMGLSKQAFDYA